MIMISILAFYLIQFHPKFSIMYDNVLYTHAMGVPQLTS